MRKKWRVGIMLLTIMSLLSGCFGKNQVLEPLQAGTIKVVYQDEDAFYRDYGKLFNMKYPQIEIEVISQTEMFLNLPNGGTIDDFYAERKKFLEKHKPDVLLLDELLFETFAQEGKLYNIEAAIQQDDYDIEGFMPGLIDKIKARGEGKLYGLAPHFEREVLYYNRALFKEHHIELPTNKMSWQELFDLSGRFSNVGSGDNPVYGLYEAFGDPGRLMYRIGSSSGLRLFDPKGEKVLINSDGWKNAIKLATNAVRNKSVFFHPQDQIYSQKVPFFKGQAAMMFNSAFVTLELKQRPTYVEGEKEIDWGVVTTPVDPSDESASITLPDIYAVAADSQNKRAAWELVKFVNGTEMAQAYSRTINGKLPTRNGYMKEINGKSTEAFYLLKVKEAEGMWDNKNVPREFSSLFDKPLLEELQAVIDNKKTIDEAVAELEKRGQETLLKAREAKESKKANERK
ncbi:ABC transporter substrate-binding protein [Paenibacillus apiarius]|uniref:Extracellular solute-binding protein n=1 Tax=Paenibacillus apiarius TaxID=46240 RepID=A0ABT4DTD5_9BACL|nr:extracellular solute-binding protein [Paenibacillus apiarius]MCY9517766.1 extracellular solute-binding protein [Paenibacillus apiarius]MCY9520589.1 extracellular solute-binding protein [Paenibacillus apiarius]MCY9555440.1 extracellular solute-binding protein [Paenibacillus apiarius]MCY9561109.1 extracellular solute-binding protein [Paenibacillus apiarius]MCY9687093.1 extracellular solute-binding protein [Paenibacillus apiarius]